MPTSVATGVASPPYVVITVTTQYSVPPKYAAPAMRPSKKDRRSLGLPAARAAATINGEIAIQAKAGWPNFGKLTASRTPERRANVLERPATGSLPLRDGLQSGRPRRVWRTARRAPGRDRRQD